jgi:hypothetical protein
METVNVDKFIMVDLTVPETGLLDSVQFVIQSQGSRDSDDVGGAFRHRSGICLDWSMRVNRF